MELGEINSLRDLATAAQQAEIQQVNSAAQIRQLLLNQANLIIELDLAVIEWNQLSATHNHLVDQIAYQRNLVQMSQDNLVDSYLNDPTYRISMAAAVRTAIDRHDRAAQAAYHTAKALEYSYLQEVPFKNDIFKARSVREIGRFLDDLEVQKAAWEPHPQSFNRIDHEISVRDLLGVADDEEWRALLQQSVNEQNILVIPLDLRLENTDLFNEYVWNERITGLGLPEGIPGTEGVLIDVDTSQPLSNQPYITLIHEGPTAQRTRAGEIVDYNAGPVYFKGFSSGLNLSSFTASIQASLGGNGGSPTGIFYNLSPSANWTLKLALNATPNRYIDIDQIYDFTIIMDTFAQSRPIRQQSHE